MYTQLMYYATISLEGVVQTHRESVQMWVTWSGSKTFHQGHQVRRYLSRSLGLDKLPIGYLVLKHFVRVTRSENTSFLCTYFQFHLIDHTYTPTLTNQFSVLLQSSAGCVLSAYTGSRISSIKKCLCKKYLFEGFPEYINANNVLLKSTSMHLMRIRRR